MSITTVEQHVDTAATPTTLGALLAWLVHWLSTADPIALLGVGLTVVGIVVNVWFKWRRDRREQMLFEEQMGYLEKGKP